MRKYETKRVTRAELTRRLLVIRDNMPFLLKLFPDRIDFFNEFSSFAEDLSESASGADVPWVNQQIEEILRDYGVSREG